jgi:hypothetical protein
MRPGIPAASFGDLLGIIVAFASARRIPPASSKKRLQRRFEADLAAFEPTF